jgi:hypothetical protein
LVVDFLKSENFWIGFLFHPAFHLLKGRNSALEKFFSPTWELRWSDFFSSLNFALTDYFGLQNKVSHSLLWATSSLLFLFLIFLSVHTTPYHKWSFGWMGRMNVIFKT